MTSNDSAKPSMINAITAGATTNISARRRPSASEIKPLNKLPNGWPMYVHMAANKIHWISNHFVESFFSQVSSNLHSHDDSTGVIWMVSFGFWWAVMPDNAGITMVENPSNKLLLRMIRFLIVATMIWVKRKCLRFVISQIRYVCLIWSHYILPEVLAAVRY